MERLFVMIAAVLGFLGVAAGAFGAHGLKKIIAAEMLQIFETGVRYQMYHALALFAVAWACGRFGGRLPVAAGWCFCAGVLIFSGSLYILALSGVKWWGAITPIGGVALLAGWLLLALAALKGV